MIRSTFLHSAWVWQTDRLLKTHIIYRACMQWLALRNPLTAAFSSDKLTVSHSSNRRSSMHH